MLQNHEMQLLKSPSKYYSHSHLPPDGDPNTLRIDLTHSSISDWELAIST